MQNWFFRKFYKLNKHFRCLKKCSCFAKKIKKDKYKI